MKYKIGKSYQNFDGNNGKRNCNDRWEFIEPHILKLAAINPKLKAIDVGSAEGYFVKKIAEISPKTKVLNIEASKEMIEFQKKYFTGVKRRVITFNDVIDENNIESLVAQKLGDKADIVLLLSVLHWFENPDIFLKKVSELTKNIIIELPNIDVVDSYNKEFTKVVKNKFGDWEKYVKAITNFDLVNKKTVQCHKADRIIYIFKNNTDE